jgi:hypothetical protein
MMRILFRTLAAIGVVAVSFLGTLFVLDRYAPSSSPRDKRHARTVCEAEDRFALTRPFAPFGAEPTFAVAADLPKLKDIADTMETSARSQLVLCEDDKQLGPSHSLHADIIKIGMGRYSHWNAALIFSASDNSNPNTNNRAYWVIVHH